MLSFILALKYIRVGGQNKTSSGGSKMGTIYDLSGKRCSEELVISKHAYARMKERNGWSKKTSTRMIRKIYTEGLRPNQVKGYLKDWVNDKADYAREDSELILFGEKLYIFNGNIMLTVLPVPSRAYLIREA